MDDRGHIREGLVLLACQQGSGRAFATLVKRWQARLWAHAHRLTGCAHAADDVIQESWIAVVKGLPGLEDVDVFPAWVFRIVTNKSTDWVRKQQRRRRLLSWLGRQPEVVDVRPAHRDGRFEALHAALATLPVEQRAVIALYYEEGFPVMEIADMLGIPPGTVKSRLYHARRQLRRQMEDADHVQ